MIFTLVNSNSTTKWPIHYVVHYIVGEWTIWRTSKSRPSLKGVEAKSRSKVGQGQDRDRLKPSKPFRGSTTWVIFLQNEKEILEKEIGFGDVWKENFSNLFGIFSEPNAQDPVEIPRRLRRSVSMHNWSLDQTWLLQLTFLYSFENFTPIIKGVVSIPALLTSQPYHITREIDASRSNVMFGGAAVGLSFMPSLGLARCFDVFLTHFEKKSMKKISSTLVDPQVFSAEHIFLEWNKHGK